MDIKSQLLVLFLTAPTFISEEYIEQFYYVPPFHRTHTQSSAV